MGNWACAGAARARGDESKMEILPRSVCAVRRKLASAPLKSILFNFHSVEIFVLCLVLVSRVISQSWPQSWRTVMPNCDLQTRESSLFVSVETIVDYYY